jgi:hypothetical protein
MLLIFREVINYIYIYNFLLLDNGWRQSQFLNNFQKLGLGGLEGPLRSCLQIYNNSHCFNQQFGHILVIIVDKHFFFTMVQFDI